MSPPAKIPVLIPASGGSLNGWLHTPVEDGGVALLICNPFGYEALCAHRALRVLAERAALAGAQVLRFDYRGTGDSGELSPGTDELRAWRANIVEAAGWLRHTSACRRLVLVGLRLGAALAQLALPDIPLVDSFIVIEPVVSGRRYLRELAALQGAFGASVPGFRETERQDQVLGYPLTESLRNSLGALDLLREAPPPCPVLVLDRSHLRLADKWILALQEQGCRVERHEADEYEAMMVDPHKGSIPHELITRAVDFIAPDHGAAPPARASAPAAALTEAGDSDSGHSSSGESVVLIHPEHGTRGVLTRPRPGNELAGRSGPAVILLNSGAIHRVGPNRLYVRWAQHWARRGISTLRVDLAGIGDSPVRQPDADNTVYSRNALEDVRNAVQFMRAQPGITAVHLMGLCSGAYHSLQAAALGAPVDGIVMINPLTFFWDHEQPIASDDLLLAKQVMRNRAEGISVQRLQALLRDPARIARTARYTADRGRQALAQRVTSLARRLRIPTRNDLGSILRELARREVRVQFVFSAGDPGRELLRVQGAPFVNGLVACGKIACAIIPDADHTFTLLRHQDELTAVLDQYLQNQDRQHSNAETLASAG